MIPKPQVDRAGRGDLEPGLQSIPGIWYKFFFMMLVIDRIHRARRKRAFLPGTHEN